MPIRMTSSDLRNTKNRQPNRQMTEMYLEARYTRYIFSKRGTSEVQARYKTWSRSLTWKRVKAANPTKFSLFQLIHGPGSLAVNVCAREEIQYIYFLFSQFIQKYKLQYIYNKISCLVFCVGDRFIFVWLVFFYCHLLTWPYVAILSKVFLLLQSNILSFI